MSEEQTDDQQQQEDGQPVRVSESHVPLELADGTRALAIPVTDWEEINARLETVTEERDEARQSLQQLETEQRTAEADTAIESAVREGRLPRDASQEWHDRYIADPVGTQALIDTLPSRAPVRELGTAEARGGDNSITAADRRRLRAAGASEEDIQELERDRAGGRD